MMKLTSRQRVATGLGLAVLGGLQLAQIVDAGSVDAAINLGQPALTTGTLVRDAFIAASVALIVWAFPAATSPPALSGRQRQVVLSAAAFVAASTVLWLVRPKTFQDLAIEDGVIEWIETLLIFGTAVSLQIAAVRWKRTGCNHLFVLAQLGAIGFFVYAGEEVSWGQRIFDFESTGAFATVNDQGETNLHNFLTVESDIALAMASAFLLGIIPMLWHRAGLAERLSSSRLTELSPLLPEAWLAMLMLLSASFNQPYWDVIPVQALTWMLAMAVASLWLRGAHGTDRVVVIVVITVAVLAMFIELAFGTWPDELVRITEYREIVVDVGLLAYGLGVLRRATAPATDQVSGGRLAK